MKRLPTAKITTGRIKPFVWRWQIHLGRKWKAGGYCRTKREALADAGSVLAHRRREWHCL